MFSKSSEKVDKKNEKNTAFSKYHKEYQKGF